MIPDDIGIVQEALIVVARFAEKDIADLTDAERDELSYAALTVGFHASRPLPEEERERLHEETIAFFAMEANVQAGQEIVYATRRPRGRIPWVRRRARRTCRRTR